MDAYRDYLILLSPPLGIAEQIRKFKQASARLIGDFEGMHSKAFIKLPILNKPGVMIR